MKKLSTLIALLICITIGSVYALWTYSGTNDIADVSYEAKVTISDTELSGANGTYTITSNLVLEIDQRDVNHYAKLVFKSNTNEEIYLKVVFTPSDNAPQQIKENGVDSELYLGLTIPMQYKMDEYGNYDENGTAVDIFVLSHTSDGDLDKNIDWTKESDGTFSYTLGRDALESMISLNTFTVTGQTEEDTFKLDTKAEHDAFSACLKGNIIVRVTDGTVN